MRIVFMGSAELACASLELLVKSRPGQIAGVVTQPDKPKGRQLKLAACPVKELASGLGLHVLSPEKISAPDSVAALAGLRPDLIAVVAYGQKIPDVILNMPPSGCINLHPSLLPKYRGAAPVQWPIVNGDAVTGITTMHVTSRMDAGDIIFQEELPIPAGATGGMMHDKLALEGAALLVRTIDAIEGNAAPRRAQDDSKATLAPKLSRDDGKIDWQMSATGIMNRVRGFNPWPGSSCRLGEGGMILKIHSVCVADGTGRPGEVLSVTGEGPVIAAGTGAVRLLQVQPEGKKPMTGAAFLCGHGLKVGTVMV